MNIRQTAINFVKTLSGKDKIKLQTMLQHNITCGSDYAKQNKVNVVQFNEELKFIFGGK